MNSQDSSSEMHRLSGKIESHDNLKDKFLSVFSFNSKINITSQNTLIILGIGQTLYPLCYEIEWNCLSTIMALRIIIFGAYLSTIRKKKKQMSKYLKILKSNNQVENTIRKQIQDLDLHSMTLVYCVILQSCTSISLVTLIFNCFNQQISQQEYLFIVLLFSALCSRYHYDNRLIRFTYIFLIIQHHLINQDIQMLQGSLGLIIIIEIILWRQKFHQFELEDKLEQFDLESAKLRQESEIKFQELIQQQLIPNIPDALTTSRGESILNKLRLLKYQSLLKSNEQQINMWSSTQFHSLPRPVLLGKESTPDRPMTVKEFKDIDESVATFPLVKNHSREQFRKASTRTEHVGRKLSYNEDYEMKKNKIQQKQENDQIELSPREIDDLIKIVVGHKDSMWVPSFLKSRKEIGSNVDLTEDLVEEQQSENISPEARKFIIGHFTEKEFQFKKNKCEIGLSSPSWHITQGLEIQSILQADNNFNFDFFELCENGIQNLSMFIQYSTFIFLKLSIHKVFQIKTHNMMIEFFKKIEQMYLHNPYHNSTHAIDVANSAAFFLSNGLEEYVTEFDQACLIISCLAHDIGHPGKNNGFMVASKSKQALVYNDQSVLESYHASILFHILQDDKTNIIYNIPSVEQKGFRKYCLQLILDTDLQKHFPLLSKFKSYVASGETNMEDEQNKLLLLSMAIKCADIGHGAKTLKLHKSWSRRINEEFFAQGDLECQLGMVVTPMCDRQQSITKSQEGFLKAIVSPLFESFNEFLRNQVIQDVCVTQIQANIKYWQDQYIEEQDGRCTFYQDTDYILQIIQRANNSNNNSNNNINKINQQHYFYEGVW